MILLCFYEFIFYSTRYMDYYIFTFFHEYRIMMIKGKNIKEFGTQSNILILRLEKVKSPKVTIV